MKDIQEFQALSKRTMPVVGSTIKVDGDDVVLSRGLIAANYSQGLAGEAGEVTDIVKKHVWHGHAISRDDVVKELGDVMHYVAGVATLFEIPMEEVLGTNIDKLKKRFPNGFNQEDSIKRVDTIKQ